MSAPGPKTTATVDQALAMITEMESLISRSNLTKGDGQKEASFHLYAAHSRLSRKFEQLPTETQIAAMVLYRLKGSPND